SSRSENTLVKDFSAITLKKFDLEFAVDPLFKKTSADFDEGGARGLLLNHLSTHDGLKIIFDASDVAADTKEEEEEGEEEGNNENGEAHEDANKEADSEGVGEPMEVTKEEEVDAMDEDTTEAEGVVVKKEEEAEAGMSENALASPSSGPEAVATTETEPAKPIADTECSLHVGKLRDKFAVGIQNIWQREICPSLRTFEFSSEGLDLPLLQADLTERDPLAENTMVEDDNELDDHFFDADMDNMGFGEEMAMAMGGGDDDDDDDDDDEDGDGERRGRTSSDTDAGSSEQMGIIPNFSEADFLASMSNNGNDLFSYFDSAINKNWAGPQHWKLLRPAKRAGKATPTANTPKKEKEQLEVDFVHGGAVDLDALFMPATASINLPKTHDRAEEQNLLPNDLQFSARRLLSLFSKPALMFLGQGRRRYIDPDMERAGADVDTIIRDTKFTEVAADDMPHVQDAELDAMGDPIFNTVPGFNDVGDDDDDDVIGGGFDAGFEDEIDDDMPIIFEAEDTEYGRALVNAARTAKPVYINYAKTAKRVDVKRLKDNIWRRLTRKSSDAAETQPESDVIDEPASTSSKSTDHSQAQGEQRFTEIMGGLKDVYARETMKDISVSFCFICLLHLANEKNLKITGNEALSDLTVMQDSVHSQQ
ncbi:condensin complex subunit 2/barren, partial [Syncephalis pseudoplumigaleata]